MIEMVPEMPDDWWPDRIIVRGSHTTADKRELHLAFVMSPERAVIDGLWSDNLKALRFALWQEIHAPTEAA